MKKIYLISTLLFLLIQGCSKEEDPVIPKCDDCDFTCIEEGNSENVITNECRDNWECTYKILLDSKVDIDNGQGVIQGSQTVFQLINSTQGAPEISDDEVSRILVFELDSTTESFAVDDEMLSTMNVQFIQYCFCPNVDFVPPSLGCLQGEKQEDGSWFVQGNLEFVDAEDGDYSVKLEALFQE